MKFQFESLAAFMAMNGHGGYVWACYAITFSALIYLVASPVIARKDFVKQQQKLQRLAEQQAAAKTPV
jgi:heme exporter protein D